MNIYTVLTAMWLAWGLGVFAIARKDAGGAVIFGIVCSLVLMVVSLATVASQH